MVSYVVYTQPATEPVSISEVQHHCRIDASNQEQAPGSFSVALGSGAGNVDNGAHRYLATFYDASGETQAGDITDAITVSNKTVNGKVSLSNIPLGGSNITGRKIYRTAANGSTYLLLATIANNTATTYTDDIADSALGAEAPSANTTGDPILNILISAARIHAETVLKRYLITQTVDMYLDYFPDWEIRLPPMQSVTSITYTDSNGIEQTLATDRYLVDVASKPARLTPTYGETWPYSRHQTNSIKIRFVAGYGTAADVPDNIKNWMLLRIKTLYESRDQLATSTGNLILGESFFDGLLDSERVYGY